MGKRESQESSGSLSNSVEIASRWYKPQWHLSPVNVHIFQTIGNQFQHFYLGVITFVIG